MSLGLVSVKQSTCYNHALPAYQMQVTWFTRLKGELARHHFSYFQYYNGQVLGSDFAILAKEVYL